MKIYNLEDRTLSFSKSVLRLCRQLQKDAATTILVNQLIRSATSIGANYREANETDTKKDFKHKIRITKKEAKETMYWLDLLLEIYPLLKKEIIVLHDESGQLMKILSSIYQKTKSV